MRYSINVKTDTIALAYGNDIDVSYKDLTAVCDAIRYLKTDRAIEVLDGVISIKRPILFTKFNTHMGSRHELAGRKGAYPKKAAKEVKTILINAIANSRNKGMDEDFLYVVHASANKTRIERRQPSKGSLSWGRGRYGMSARTHSDLEYAKIEIGVSGSDSESLTLNMKRFILARNPIRAVKQKASSTVKPKVANTQVSTAKPAQKSGATVKPVMAASEK